MSKAILVMDMPKCCYQCPCFSITECRAYKCGTKVEDDRKKPDWCPLKEMPNKQTHSSIDNEFQRGAKSGFNHCIDVITNQ